MNYIAYGSNMNTRQMASRCPGAKLIGTGKLLGEKLSFYVHATVERSGIKCAYVPVAIWEISHEHEELLDRYEGFPNYYVKEKRTVHMDDGTIVTGMIYIMNLKRAGLPSRDYFHGILSAYHALGLGSDIKKVLEPALTRALRQGGLA